MLLGSIGERSGLAIAGRAPTCWPLSLSQADCKAPLLT